jgi:hypothetical protein
MEGPSTLYVKHHDGKSGYREGRSRRSPLPSISSDNNSIRQASIAYLALRISQTDFLAPPSLSPFSTVSQSAKQVFQWYSSQPPDYRFVALLRPQDFGRAILLVYTISRLEGTSASKLTRLADLFRRLVKSFERYNLPADHDLRPVSDKFRVSDADCHQMFRLVSTLSMALQVDAMTKST